ncbi:tail fiber assembly protein [Kosakonia radicincitans]|uniref:tail fiber assembly protein n=1 Tax=Kosakonia radicincitans TaxID=283686 RepID=UPI000461C4FE|nr:tail fiber assembly protein [Kosakonia radicincitans]KDE35160.1 tail fiber assembly protein [Kosakonia radicincitans UMEnt01/12]SET69629.1 virus tail fibre assembly protein, lambda gpK [Kosakonia radicincitans]
MIILNFQFSGEERIAEFTVTNLRSEEGYDWYQSQALFDPEKIKIEYEKDGVITRFSKDVSMLWPIGKSVAEIASNLVPEGLNEKGEWMFDGQQIIPVSVDYVANAEAYKQSLLKDAAMAIAPIQDAVDLEVAADEEMALLSAWKMYRVMVNRVNTSLAPDIEWPEKPIG